MYVFDSGVKALAEQLRRKALPPPSIPLPEHKERATYLRTEADARLIEEAQRKTRAALRLQNERARKKKEEFERKIEEIRELKEAKERERILRRLKL